MQLEDEWTTDAGAPENNRVGEAGFLLHCLEYLVPLLWYLRTYLSGHQFSFGNESQPTYTKEMTPSTTDLTF